MAIHLKASVEHNGCSGIMGTYGMFNMSQKNTGNLAIKGITRLQALYTAHGYTWIHMDISTTSRSQFIFIQCLMFIQCY